MCETVLKLLYRRGYAFSCLSEYRYHFIESLKIISEVQKKKCRQCYNLGTIFAHHHSLPAKNPPIKKALN